MVPFCRVIGRTDRKAGRPGVLGCGERIHRPAAAMLTMLLCSILALVALGWVLGTNARDRKVFEKELEADLADDDSPDRPWT